MRNAEGKERRREAEESNEGRGVMKEMMGGWDVY